MIVPGRSCRVGSGKRWKFSALMRKRYSEMRTQDCHDRSSLAAVSKPKVPNSSRRDLRDTPPGRFRLRCRIFEQPVFIWLGLLVLALSSACQLTQASEPPKPDGGKPEGGKPDDSKPPLHWRDSLACGQTSCYVLLKLCGAPHSLDAVRAAVPVTAGKGTNLAEMARGCKQLGLDVDIVRSAPSELDRAPLPVIAHLSYPVATQHNEFAASELIGHFVVVVGMDDQTIAMIDASSPVGASPLVHINRGSFCRQWTGELLVKHAEATNKWSNAVGPLLCGFTSLTLVAVWYLAPRRRLSGAFGVPAVPK
jgi:Peptidase C39 family